MATIAKIDIDKYIRCSTCGETLRYTPVGAIREHADNVYSFVCAVCAGVV